jgi:hypothetical protein
MYVRSGDNAAGTEGKFQKVLTVGSDNYPMTAPKHGDILIFHGSEPTWINKAVGKNREVLMSDGATPTWVSPQNLDVSTEISVACSDETSPLTTGTKITFRTSHGMRFYASTGNANSSVNTDGPGISASVTSFASGQAIFIDILESGYSLFNGTSYLKIDKGERTSKTAATGYVLDTSSAPRANKLVSGLAYDSEITVVVKQVGGTPAKPWPGAGLKLHIRGAKAQ